MTSAECERPSGAGQQSVAELLAPLHHRWFQRVHERLASLLVPDAPIWARWPAARFLSDQFVDWFDHEQRLVQSLTRCLRPAEVRHLVQSAAALASIRQELDELGRRHGNGQTVDITHRFFARLELWRTEVEAALAGLSCDQLTDDDRRLLGHLQRLAERGQ